MYVAVPHRSHGDDGPVQGGGHRVEHRPLLVLLPDVGQSAEDQHPHDDHEHQQPQLLVAVPQSHPEGLEPRDVPGQFEYPQYSHDPEDLRDPPHLRLSECLVVSLTALGGGGDEGEEERHEVGQDAQQVYHVHGSLHEPEQTD